MPGFIQGLMEGMTFSQQQEEVAQKRAAEKTLAQSLAGMSPEDLADPTAQMNALMQAGSNLARQGYGAAGFQMIKQADALQAAARQQRLDKLTVAQSEAEAIGRELQGATSLEDLVPLEDRLRNMGYTETQIRSFDKEIRDAVNSGMKFEDIKKGIIARAVPVQKNIENERKALEAELKAEKEARLKDAEKFKEAAKEKDQALAQEKEKRLGTQAERRLDIAERALKQRGQIADARLKIAQGTLDLRKIGEDRKQVETELKIADKILSKGGSFEDLSPVQKRILAALDVMSEEAPKEEKKADKFPTVTPEEQKKRDVDRLQILQDELKQEQPKADKGDARAKANVDAINREIASLKGEKSAPDVAKVAKQRTMSINYAIKDPAKRVEEAEVKTALSQVDSKYWNSIKTPKTVNQITGALGVSREAQNISDFIKKNPVQTGFFGSLASTLDKFDPRTNADVAIGSAGFAGNEAKLSKLVLDFANQYAKSARGGANPIATVTELKAALATFGTAGMSPASAAESFKFIGDHYLEQKGKELFNDENSIKPSYYKESGASKLSPGGAGGTLPKGWTVVKESK